MGIIGDDKMTKAEINRSIIFQNIEDIYMASKILTSIKIGDDKTEFIRKTCAEERSIFCVNRALNILLSTSTIIFDENDKCKYISTPVYEKALVVLEVIDEFFEMIRFGIER